MSDRQEGNREVYEADIYYNAKWEPNQEVDLNKANAVSPPNSPISSPTNSPTKLVGMSCPANSPTKLVGVNCLTNSPPKFKNSFKARMAKKLQAEKERQRKAAAKAKPKRNLNFRELKEGRRVYIFPGNNRVIVENVCRIAIMDSGIHRLETTTGEKHIIPTGWLAIKISSEEWNF